MTDMPNDAWILVLSHVSDALCVLQNREICKASLSAFPHVACKIHWRIAPIFLQRFLILNPRLDHIIHGTRYGDLSLEDCVGCIIPIEDKFRITPSVCFGDLQNISIAAVGVVLGRLAFPDYGVRTCVGFSNHGTVAVDVLSRP